MATTSYGKITIIDVTDITDVYLEYCMVEAGRTASEVKSKTTWVSPEVEWNTIYPTWQSGYEIWIRQVQIKEGIDEPERGEPYLDTAVNQINITINAAEANIIALQSRLKKIWTNLTNSTSYPAGTYAASGIDNRDVIENDSSTYGYNTFLNQAKLALRYNAIDMTALTTNALTFYIPTKDSNNNWIQGTPGLIINSSELAFYQPSTNNRTLSLTSNGLSLYGSPTSTPDATLTSNGLKLVKGGIEAGKPNTNDFVYISSTDFVGSIEPFYRLTLDTEIENGKTYYEYDKENDTYSAISSPTIEDIDSYYEYYTPSQGAIAIDNFVKRNWRQIIGTNFAVDSDGNLYASNVDISGTIDAESGSIGGFKIGNSELYSSGHQSPASQNNGIYIGPDELVFGSNRTIYFTQAGEGKIGPWYFNNNILANNTEIVDISFGTNGLNLSKDDEIFSISLPNSSSGHISINMLEKIIIENGLLTINAITDNKNDINTAFTYINSYNYYITTTSNNTSGYIQLKRKSNNNASSIKITDSIIELSINQNTITTYSGNLMHTTFGEFENLRMRVGTTGSLTWIARSNGHLSLKVVN